MGLAVIVRWMWILLAVFAISGEADAGQIRLNSGKSVVLLAMGPMLGQGWSALQLKYRTSLPITDTNSLRNEADELWQRFVIDAEKGGYTSAIISANDSPQGFIVTHNQSFNFVYKKANGAWHTLEAESRERLDRKFVIEFVARLDAADLNSEVNSLALYIADDFVMAMSSEVPGVSLPPKINRAQFATGESATLNASKNHHQHREILGISISKDGLYATVESRESTELEIGNHHFANVVHYQDAFELRGPYMLWTKSNSVTEKQTDVVKN